MNSGTDFGLLAREPVKVHPSTRTSDASGFLAGEGTTPGAHCRVSVCSVWGRAPAPAVPSEFRKARYSALLQTGEAFVWLDAGDGSVQALSRDPTRREGTGGCVRHARRADRIAEPMNDRM